MSSRIKNETQDLDRMLIYYFAFPNYRLTILQSLQQKLGARLKLQSGTANRDGIKPLEATDLQGLEVVESLRLGPFSWDKNVWKAAVSKHYQTAIVAPAVSSLSTWVIVLLRRLGGRDTYLWGQCGHPGDRSFKRFLQELLNRMATGLLVYGSVEASGAAELGCSSKKIHEVRNTAPLFPTEYALSDLTEKMRRTTEAALSDGELRLTYVGRVNPDKHVEVLLQAGEILKEKFPNLSVCIIGDGPDRLRLQEKYSDPRYRFLGAIYDKKLIHSELVNSNFVVAPSKMGLLAIDALSAGTPAMIPDNPRNGSEFESLTFGTNCFGFRKEDAEDLALQICNALKAVSLIDMESYFSSREKGMSDWSPERVAQNIIDVVVPRKN